MRMPSLMCSRRAQYGTLGAAIIPNFRLLECHVLYEPKNYTSSTVYFCSGIHIIRAAPTPKTTCQLGARVLELGAGTGQEYLELPSWLQAELH